MQPLLVRFEKSQRSFIRKTARRFKESEASYVRRQIDHAMASRNASVLNHAKLKATRSTTESNAHQKENGDTPNTSTKGGDGSPVTI